MYNKKNIISLIGMTGVGKTTVGQVLAEKLNFDFFDLDLIITEKAGKNTSELFALYGEESFRKTEMKELRDIFQDYKSRDKKLVLSCGGGIVLKEENREILRENSFVVWLLRPFDEILKNGEILKRPPINNDAKNYAEIFKRREKLYSETCAGGLKIEYTDVSEAVENIMGFIT